jgi:hypothetical protein
MSRRSKFVFTLAFLSVALLSLRGSILTVPSGTWQPIASLSVARSGAASAALLQNGSVLLGHGTNVVVLEATFRMGNLFLSSVDGTYIDYIEKTPQELLSVPHFIGISRELALSRLGTWIGSLFIYEPPHLGFRPSEQRLLLAALRGGRDEDLAHELGLSLSAVKKRWLSIYERVAACDSRIIPIAHSGHDGASERGKEKKQRLLAYLREHPEELVQHRRERRCPSPSSNPTHHGRTASASLTRGGLRELSTGTIKPGKRLWGITSRSVAATSSPGSGVSVSFTHFPWA